MSSNVRCTGSVNGKMRLCDMNGPCGADYNSCWNPDCTAVWMDEREAKAILRPSPVQNPAPGTKNAGNV